MIFADFDLFLYFIWILTDRNTISRHTYRCCKKVKVKIINKSRKMVSHHILPFSVWVQTVLIKMGSCVYILMANEVYIVTFTFYFQTFVNILSFFGEPIFNSVLNYGLEFYGGTCSELWQGKTRVTVESSNQLIRGI